MSGFAENAEISCGVRAHRTKKYSDEKGADRVLMKMTSKRQRGFLAMRGMGWRIYATAGKVEAARSRGHSGRSTCRHAAVNERSPAEEIHVAQSSSSTISTA